MSAQVTPEFLEQLEDLIQYVWEDEEAHWEEAGRPDNHIFVKIKKLNDWLAGVTNADVRSLTQHAPDVAKATAQKGVLHKNRSGKRAGVAQPATQVMQAVGLLKWANF